MQAVFEILWEPNRRAIVGLLAQRERSVGEIQAELGLAQPSVSKHLKTLRERGFVEVRADAQRRLYALRPAPLMQLDDWLEPYRRLWNTSLDKLGRHLDRMPGGAEPRRKSARKKGRKP